MKILLATFWEIPHLGGVWNYMNQLKGKLENRGHEVEIAGYGKKSNHICLISSGQIITKAQIGFIPHSAHQSIDEIIAFYENQIRFYTSAMSMVDLNQYDLIHTQDVLSSLVFGKIKPPHAAHIATLHGSVGDEIKKSFYIGKKDKKSLEAIQYFNNLENSGASAAYKTIVANQWMKTKLCTEYGVNEQQLMIRHYGYDIEQFLELQTTPSLLTKPADKKLILYSGRLNDLKGVPYLIKALQKLKEIRSDWVCWIAGEGPKENEYKQHVSQLQLQNDILFLGVRSDIPALLKQADLLIHPTLLDNQPLSIIEAQISGTAVIASEAGGVPEMMEHGMTGVLVPPADSDRLCENIAYLLEHDDYRNNVGLRAQEWAFVHWHPELETEDVLAIYSEAVQNVHG